MPVLSGLLMSMSVASTRSEEWICLEPGPKVLMVELTVAREMRRRALGGSKAVYISEGRRRIWSLLPLELILNEF